MMDRDNAHREGNAFQGTGQAESIYGGDLFFKDDDRFTGNELEEEPDPTLQSIPRDEVFRDPKKGLGRKRWLWPCIALVLCVALGLGYLSVKRGQVQIPGGFSGLEENTEHRLPMPDVSLMHFQSFIIPLRKETGLTYLTFSISFYVPNKRVQEEIMRREEQLRGILYDMLTQHIKKVHSVPPLEILKKLIVQGVNVSLSDGGVREVYITRFLAV
jgi:flagellar basal body-associated protein FliL